MTIIANGQSFSSSANSGLVNSLGSTFEAGMHTVLLGGRDVVLDLPPGKSPCPDTDCKYNSTYNRYTGNGTALCRSCGGQGFTVEQRQTIYKANIRWTNEKVDLARNGGENTPAGKVAGNYVRVKTHISSFDHINQAIGITVDGIKCILDERPRQTAWGETRYFIISWWREANQNVSNG